MSPADIVISPASAYSLTALGEIFSRSFEGYFVPLSGDPAALAARIRLDHIDLAASRVVERSDHPPVGIAFIARRGDACRLAEWGLLSRGAARASAAC